MSGLKEARVSLSIEEQQRLERERQNRANRREALRLLHTLQEAMRGLDTPFVRSRCASQLEAMRQKAEEVGSLCQRNEFTPVVEQADALRAAIDAVEAGCWSVPAEEKKAPEGQETGVAAQGSLARLNGRLAALRQDEVIQKWMRQEVAALERRLLPLRPYVTGKGAWRGEIPRRWQREVAQVEAELEQLVAEAELLDAQDMQRRRLIEGFQGALGDLGFAVGPPDYEPPAHLSSPANPRAPIRMRACRADGAEILLAFPLEGDQVKTDAGGFHEGGCLADYRRLIQGLHDSGIEARFTGPAGPILAPDAEAIAAYTPQHAPAHVQGRPA